MSNEPVRKKPENKIKFKDNRNRPENYTRMPNSKNCIRKCPIGEETPKLTTKKNIEADDEKSKSRAKDRSRKQKTECGDECE